MPESYFTCEIRDDAEWLLPTDFSRGPWNADACHGGPVAGVLVRALERTLPHQRLARITIELSSPVPMAGFRIDTAVLRSGRATGQTSATLVDDTGTVRTTAVGMHVRVSEAPLLADTLDNSDLTFPRLADTEPGPFLRRSVIVQQWPGFRDSTECRYPRRPDADPSAVYMRTPPLLPDEPMSPFQRVTLLADCGNAFSRHDHDGLQFMNTDLSITLHRDPEGEWIGSRSMSFWQPNGVGLADATLYDDRGPIGRALQTLLLRPGAVPSFVSATP